MIGSGAVGVEFASMYARFGSKVTIVEVLPRIVPLEDEEISRELAASFKRAGDRDLSGHAGRAADAGPMRASS